MVEQWTREKRLERTRSLLLDAAEEVFADKGFAPASLDDIARTAGYTKGAIYKHFATKEDLFFAVSDRYWRRYFDNFAEVLSSATEVGARELDAIAARWRQLSLDRGAEHSALGHEFTLYLLRNPEARERVAGKRSEVVEALSAFISVGMERMGATLLIAPLTFVHFSMMQSALHFAFAAAVLGGIGSMPGALLGGVIIGVTSNLTGAYLSSEWKDAVPFIVMLAILILRPHGLLARHQIKKV